MENILADDYGQLEEIIKSHCSQPQGFTIQPFIQQMEAEFTRLGFRDKSARGGVENILLIRLDAVGDYILTSAAIRTVRENFPAAHITLIVSKRIYPLAELCPYVNEVLPFEQEQGLSAEMVANVTNFAREHLWKRRYDMCFYLGIVFRPVRNFLMYLSGAWERISFQVDEFVKFFSTKSFVPMPEYFRHDCLTNLYLLKLAGLKISSANLEVWYDKTDLFKARKLLEGFAVGRIKIAVGIGAAQPSRKYPIEKYLVAFKAIIAKGAAIVIFGGSAEVDDAKFLEDNLPKEFVKNFVEVKAGWRVDTAAISLTDLYIGNFTGICDISAALKKPVIVLSRVSADIKIFFDGYDESISYHPFQTYATVLRPAHQLEECRAKPYYTGCRANEPHCIAQIEPSEIVNACDEMIYFTKSSRIKKFGESPNFIEDLKGIL